MQIRRAEAHDAAGIARMHVASWQAAYAGILDDAYLAALDWRERAVRWSARIGEPAVGQVILVAVDDEPAVRGFVTAGPRRDDDAEPGDLEVYGIYIDPTIWDTGLGTELMDAVLAELDAPSASVSLWVLEGNERARHFYERHGFRPDGVSKTEEIGPQQVIEYRLVRRVGH